MKRSDNPHLVTSSIDSAMMRPDIFDVPNCRSRKTIGVSTIVDPLAISLRASSVKKAYPSAVVDAGSIARSDVAR